LAHQPSLAFSELRLGEPLLQSKAREGRYRGRIIEIQKVDAVRLYVSGSLWKQIGQRRLDAGERTRA
jgi:hypothetical protein